MEFEVKATFPAKRKQLYKAWLNSKKHTAMTGGEAKVSKKIGASFSAWDGYIQGINLVLEPKKRIVQNWRTSEFEENEENSQVEILFKKVKKGTEVKIIHTNLPAHGEQYRQGWIDHYFTPMMEYFAS
jgi:activator of HSP90 ATPase